MHAENQLVKNRPEALERLFELLRIPSISTDPKWASDCARAAEFLKSDLQSIGFDARVVASDGHPFVLAHSPKVANAPHVLFYGHYDVQPIDPIELWTQDPFNPSIIERDGKKVIHGRGASDDKGQIMTFVEACRALSQTGGIPLNITILFEGEEETGSPSLPQFFEDYSSEIKADFALVCDTGMFDENTPAISSQLRGLMGEIVTIYGARTDLHSGLYGGAAQNPAHILTSALASLRNPDGSIALDGFYDGVAEIKATLRAEWQNLHAQGKAHLENVGLHQPAGEAEFDIWEQIWARPTMEINGIWSGYTGEGFKTVLPARADAKISFRLVDSQDPEKIRQKFRDTLRSKIPPDCSIEFNAHGGSPAVFMDTERAEFQKAKTALDGIWENNCIYIGMGGSIPIVGSFKEKLNMESILLGFAQASDQIHAPNEKYDLQSFQKGALAWLRILQALSS